MDWSMAVAALAFAVGYTIFAGKADKNKGKPEWKDEKGSRRKKKK